MEDWDNIKCNKCPSSCNRKGGPSVMKGSAFCQMQRGTIDSIRVGMWTKIRNSKIYNSMNRIYQRSRGR